MRKELSIGPGAASLLLVAVVVSMCVLGLLSALDVRSDLRLTDRSTALITSQYDASAEAERDLAALDAAVCSARKNAADDASFTEALAASLPEGMTLDGDLVSWEIALDDMRTLQCAVRVRRSAGTDRITWVTHCFVSTISEDGFEEFE